ncbi:MAG TPA: tetratricopeptide repeat protein [Gemmatimonadales bacterium]
MADDVRAMTRELARDPDSLVFIPLGEELRRRGQLDMAAKVAASGIERHPNVADARDLYARVLIDAGNPAAAEDAWRMALRLEPRHAGAHKGMGFLLFQAGDLDGALDHLETALSADPTDATIVQALQTVRAAAEALADSPPPQERVFAGFDGGGAGVLLADERGLVLAGTAQDASGARTSDAVAAHVAGAAREAERTARLIGLGDWVSIAVEGPDGHLHLSRPTVESVLLVKRDRSVPPGRVALLAQRAAATARQWLEAGNL